MQRRQFLAGVPAVALGLGTTRISFAQKGSFPSQPVTLIVPFPPGGPTDAMIRLLGEGLRREWNQPVIIDNKPGAGTIIGTHAVARAKPDGHTMGVVIAAHTANPSLRDELPYDTFKDLSGVSMLATAPVGLYANNDFPANNLKEFLEYAKANRGKLSYGSVGAGSQAHIAGEAFSLRTDTDMIHIPYKGSAPAQADLLGGHLPLLFDALPSGIELVKNGKMKLLAIGSAERSPLVPDVMTFSEVVPGFIAEAFFALIVPSSTPKETVEQLYEAVQKVVRSDEYRAWLNQRGFSASSLGKEDLDRFFVEDYQRWNEVIKKANIKIS